MCGVNLWPEFRSSLPKVDSWCQNLILHLSCQVPEIGGSEDPEEWSEPRFPEK